MPITLLSPPRDSTTEPLQLYPWPREIARLDFIKPATGAPIIWNALQMTHDVDRGLPRPVSFAWESDEEGGAFDLLIDTSPTFASPRVIADLAEPQADVLHLHLGTRYYWKVIAKRDGEAVAESPVHTFITHDLPPRWIFAPGTTNVRDLGGWPLPGGGRVRQGMVYRSSEMNGHLTISDEGKRVLEEEVGIRTDLDLRGEGEPREPVLDESRVQWVNIPVAPYGHLSKEPVARLYRDIFSHFADPAFYPVIFHCWGGADRAGTVAFLLGALLGVSREDLIREYELTALSIWGPRLHTSAEFTALLDVLAPYGESLQAQAEGYLLAAGVTAEQIQAIRELMRETD